MGRCRTRQAPLSRRQRRFSWCVTSSAATGLPAITPGIAVFGHARTRAWSGVLIRSPGRAMTGISWAAPMSVQCSLGRLYCHMGSSQLPTAPPALVRMSPQTRGERHLPSAQQSQCTCRRVVYETTPAALDACRSVRLLLEMQLTIGHLLRSDPPTVSRGRPHRPNRRTHRGCPTTYIPRVASSSFAYNCARGPQIGGARLSLCLLGHPEGFAGPAIGPVGVRLCRS